MNANLSERYQHINHCPDAVRFRDAAASVLHSLCAAKGYSWAEAYEHLISACGEVGLMPYYRDSIRKLLEREGYYLQAASFARRPVAEILAECDTLFHDGETVIVNCSGGMYMPLVPVQHGSGIRYVLQFPADELQSRASELWIAWKDGQDHSIKPRRKTAKNAGTEKPERAQKVEDNEALHVYNENPGGNLIGDCAVRAVAGVLEISWEEAVRKLAAAQDYTEIVINTDRNIEALLQREGFQEFGPIRRSGKILTGKQFCDHIHDMFQAGTRIFAYVGRNHAAAILVFDHDYKIVDTWDSTDRPIIKYWARYPERQRRRPEPEPEEKPAELAVGVQLRHKMYGTGEVTALDGQTVSVRFQNGLEKKMAAAWILANCKLL